MRGLRSFAGLLIVLIGLGSYLYFVESKRTPGDDEEKREKVFAVEADKIDEITITTAAGERTTLKKTGADWQIVQPAAGQPDAAEISSLTSNLSSVEIQRVIDEQAADLKEYGLDPARVEVGFKSGGQEHTLLVGVKTPSGSDAYARLDGQKKVFLIPSHLEGTFNKSTFDLRDKAILKLDQDAIDALEVATGTNNVSLGKKDGEWRLTQPLAAPADFSVVSGLVARLTSAQMKAVEPPSSTDPAKYGLDKPSATIRIGSGSSRATLQVGGPATEGTVYARDESRPEIFTVESSLLDELKKTPADYRKKDLFDARTFNATRLDVTRGGQTVAFERTKARDKDGNEAEKWRQVAPEAKDVDGAKVDALIAAATGTQALSFVEDAGKAAQPQLELAIKYDAGRKEDRVAFLRAGADTFAIRSGVPGAAKIDSAALDSILKTLDDIK